MPARQSLEGCIGASEQAPSRRDTPIDATCVTIVACLDGAGPGGTSFCWRRSAQRLAWTPRRHPAPRRERGALPSGLASRRRGGQLWRPMTSSYPHGSTTSQVAAELALSVRLASGGTSSVHLEQSLRIPYDSPWRNKERRGGKTAARGSCQWASSCAIRQVVPVPRRIFSPSSRSGDGGGVPPGRGSCR